MRGKDKCRILKQIRKKIADENEIPYVVEECKHKGECKGTCPKCEADLKMLERELSLRHKIGKTVAIAGIAAGMMTMTTGCDIDDVTSALKQIVGIESHNPVMGEMLPPETGVIELDGDVAVPQNDGWLGGLVYQNKDIDWDVTEGEMIPPELQE
ncbi:MAG: hypothetical protein II553_01610 [Lachnospiraceae bacterium]|nr:hypothetical protein [Lachnospiraceae bacterium]MBQ2557692.1 hypothetical protein [Lachnospiraceae bacterium]